MCELADLCLLELPETAGPTRCFALVQMLTNGKTNKWGKKQFMGSIRAKDPMFCTMGALAQSFFYRWQICGEQQPDFSSRAAWYRTKLLVGKDKTQQQELSWRQQYDDIVWLFSQCNVHSSHLTHAPRAAGPQQAELHGVSEKQV